MAKKILIVEDERDIGDLLKLSLQKEGYEVETCEDGETALRKWEDKPFDLALLDLMLPGVDGLEVCRRLRSNPRTADLAIIMITAKGEEVDRIVGLEMGADDYITKPFSPREVLARLKAVFRRTEKPKPGEKKYEYEGILLDSGRYEASYKGEHLSLTSKEFKLLEFFLDHKGRVLSRDQLLNEIWGYDYFGTSRTVDVHVAHLRRKFPVLNKTLISVKGLGYKLQEEPAKS